MTYDPHEASDDRLQEIFDETAARASDVQLGRMLARAQRTPVGKEHPGRKRAVRPWFAVLAAAAAVLLAVGGAWWVHGSETTAGLASSAVPTRTVADLPTATATATAAWTAEHPEVASGDSQPGPASADDDYDDEAWLPGDPLAALDGDWEDDDLWTSEIDLLYGPEDEGEGAFWDEMDRLVLEGG